MVSLEDKKGKRTRQDHIRTALWHTNGNPQADSWNVVYDYVSSLVQSTCRRVPLNDIDQRPSHYMEDLTQQVMLRLLTMKTPEDSSRNPEYLVRAIVRRTYTDSIRKSFSAPKKLPFEENKNQTEEETLSRLCLKEDIIKALSCLRRLPLNTQEEIRAHVENPSYQELGRIFPETPIGTLKSDIHRAEKKLRDQLCLQEL